MARHRILRVFAIVMLSLLALEYEMGMSLNLSPRLQETTAVGSVGGMLNVLGGVGADAVTHGILGSLLAVFAAATLVLALLSGAASVTVVGILAFLGTAGAALNGILFTSSGFHDDGTSAGMASGFLLAFTFYFILVCVLSVKIRGQKVR